MKLEIKTTDDVKLDAREIYDLYHDIDNFGQMTAKGVELVQKKWVSLESIKSRILSIIKSDLNLTELEKKIGQLYMDLGGEPSDEYNFNSLKRRTKNDIKL